MDELNKKKVTELRQALREKGLPITGTKPDLVKRLFEALGGAASEDTNVDDGFQEIDEDDILNEDPAPVKQATTLPGTIAQTTKVSGAADSASSVGVVNAGSASTAVSAVSSAGGDNAKAAKPGEVSKLSEAERLKLRAERFGAVSSDAKKELRAQRFGLPTSDSGSLKGTVPVDAEVLKKRAERFGVVAPSLTKADEDERKRKRAERFGSSGTVSTKSNGLSSTEDEIKKRKRAERFGLAS